MNKVILMGRLTKDPDVRSINAAEGTTLVVRYTLAVDRRNSKDGQQSADFISVVVWNKGAEFAYKYLHKGSKILLTGRIQTGSYTNKDGATVYTTEVVAEEQEFAESKKNDDSPAAVQGNPIANEGFMNIPEGIDEDLPFALPSR